MQHIVLVRFDSLAASYLQDPRAELLILRRLAEQGAGAEGMITTFPSVTWPSHTTLVTGATAATHGVIGNAVFDRKAGQNLAYIGDPVHAKELTVCALTPTKSRATP